MTMADRTIIFPRDRCPECDYARWKVETQPELYILVQSGTHVFAKPISGDRR
jgi:hypothetical protein